MERKFKELPVPKDAIINPDGISHYGMQFWKNKKNNFTVAVCHYTADQNKRSENWFHESTRNLRQDQILREYEIDFTSKSGQKAFFYLSAEPERYLKDDWNLREVPKSWRIIAGLDYGTTNPTAILIAGIDQSNRINILWEFYKPSSTREISMVLKGEHPDYPHPFWKRIERVMADPSIWKGDQNLEGREELYSVADILENKGIYNLERATNSRIAGWDRLQELFNYKPNNPDAKPCLFISKRCKNLWREMNGLVFDEIPPHLLIKKNQKEDIVGKDDHAADALRYLCMSVTEPASEEAPPENHEYSLIEMEKAIDKDYDNDEDNGFF